jgi:hypothetical protein
MIVSFDGGKYQVRVVHEDGQFSYLSKLYPYRELNLQNDLSENDLIIEFNGKTYMGGDLGEREGKIPIQFTDTSKSHPTTLIHLLVALHRLPNSFFKVVVGTPIKHRTEAEKHKLKSLLLGTQRITVNGRSKIIKIEDVEIGAEGASGFWSDPLMGEVQGLDFGSTTVNYYYMQDKKFINKKSGTFPYGAENAEMDSPEATMEAIYSQLSNKFNKNNPTQVMGGLAYTMIDAVQNYYPNAYVVKDPIFATSQGLYQIARAIYE